MEITPKKGFQGLIENWQTTGNPLLDEYFRRLEDLKQLDESGKQVMWSQSSDEQTMFYGDGRSGDIETTALAALALMKSGKHAATVKGALTWLITQKDASGTWHSTQATVLTLKAQKRDVSKTCSFSLCPIPILAVTNKCQRNVGV